MSAPSFDATLQSEPCSSCAERVVKTRAGCPVCCARNARAASRRPLVAPAVAPTQPEETGWRVSRRPALAGRAALEPPPGPAARSALRELLRALGPLGEESPLLPRPHALLPGGAGVLVDDPDGAPPAPGLEPARLLALAADLARLDRALRQLGLSLPLGTSDLRLGAAGLGIAPEALPRLTPALAHDRRADAVAWGSILAELLGAPRTPAGVALEETGPAPPALLAAVRSALRGEGTPEEVLARALGAPLPRGPRPALEARAAAARAGAIATLDDPSPERGPFLLLTQEQAGDGVAAFLALDLTLDAVVRLETVEHPDADPAAVLARRQAFAVARPGAFAAAPLDPALRAAPAPALRVGEPWAIRPCRLAPDPAPVLPELPPPPGLTVRASGSQLELAIEPRDGVDAVLLVRGREGTPLLVPEDGELVRSLPRNELDLTVTDPAPAPGARYAAFPLRGGQAGPPARASAGAVEVGALRLEPRIGAIHLAWDAPEGAVVCLRAGPAPLSGPGEGQPLVWARERRELLHDCLDADQEVHYRAALLGPDGTLSPGLSSSAAALGPPPPLGEVRASSEVGRVVLAWTWPASRSYDRARVRRDPAWPEGEREVPRGEAPCLIDQTAPVGRRVRYKLKAALGPHQGRAESEAAGVALAEVVALRARPAGGAVELELELPGGLPEAGWEVRLCRSAEHEPKDANDGTLLEVPSSLRLVDGPLPPGRTAFYRACLLVDGRPSPGVTARAVPTEPAGALEAVEVVGERNKIAVRWTPPRERCERVLVLAGPAGDEPREVAVQGAGCELEVPPGVPWRVRLVPVHQGTPDAAQAVERTATAWDDLTGLAAEAAPDGVLLRWTPPAGTPTAYRLRHRAKGRADEPWSEVKLPGETPGEHLLQGLPPRRAYQLELACLFGEAVTAPQTVEATALATPPLLPEAELSLAPGEVRARFLPAAPSERLHWEKTTLYLTSRRPAELLAALGGREWFREAEAAALGLTEAATRPRGKQRETITASAPAGVGTALLCSVNGPLRRVVALGPALRIEAGALALRAEPAAAPTIVWSRPAWANDPVQLVRLELRRGLEEAALDGLPAAELEELSLPLARDLPPTSERFQDDEALPYVSWGYQLEATLEVDGRRATLQGPRLVVPAIEGGTLKPAAAQARGFLGKKHQVEVTFQAGPPAPRAWPAFELLRCVGDQQDGKVIAKVPGGTAQPAAVQDADLQSFTKGTRLTYRVRLANARDKLGWSEGSSTLVLG